MTFKSPPFPGSDNDSEIHPEAAEAPGYLANHAARVFSRLVDTRLRLRDLSLSLIGPVLLLSWRGAMLQRDLVKHSAVKQPAMVALLDKLEALGLIERSQTIDDKRAAKVALTERGCEAALTGRMVLLEVNALGTSGFSHEETQEIVALTKRLIKNLEQQT